VSLNLYQPAPDDQVALVAGALIWATVVYVTFVVVDRILRRGWIQGR
jgi:hypothetical protein